MSPFNEAEADFIVVLYATLIFLFEAEKPNTTVSSLRKRIAVITPYQEQKQLLRRKFKNFYGRFNPQGFSDLDPVEISTIDGFQGEKNYTRNEWERC